MTKLCECGCGQPAPIADRTDRSSGRVKGQPQRFVRGHGSRLLTPLYVIDADSGCWVWQRRAEVRGYGSMRDAGRTRLAHRVFYERHIGPIPPGMQIDHVCRNPKCVNPSHLRLATDAQNKQNLAPVGRSGNRRGVYFHKLTGKWCARVRLNGHSHYLGLHDTEDQAGDVASAFRAMHMPFSPDARAVAT